MLPDPVVIMQSPFVVRDPETDEISWPPPNIELELMELGLIPRRTNGKELDVEPKQDGRRKDRVVYTQRSTVPQAGAQLPRKRSRTDGCGTEDEE